MQNSTFRGIQLTLCILKPHVLAAPHAFKEIRKIIDENGFQIAASKHGNITKTEANAFYEEHVGKFFFNRLLTFMCSGPCAVYVLAKENAIDDWRKLLGPTKVYKAQFTHPGSIRGRVGLTDTRNAAHGSDSEKSAENEIRVFFPDFDVNAWLNQCSDPVKNDKFPEQSKKD